MNPRRSPRAVRRAVSNAQVHAAAGPYALGALPDDERLAYEHHLAACEVCQVEVSELQASLVALSRSVAQAPPEKARSEVLAQADLTRQSPPLPRFTPRGSAALGGRWTQVAAALLAVLVLVTGGAAVRLSGQVAQIQAQADDRQAALNAQVAELQAETGHAQQLAALLTAPGVRTVALDAPSGTTARVLADGQGLGLLVADGLAVPPGSTAYQLWLLDGTRTRPAGLFTPAARGPSIVPITGTLNQAQRIAVTIEPAGGSTAPTSPIVMQGALAAAAR